MSNPRFRHDRHGWEVSLNSGLSWEAIDGRPSQYLRAPKKRVRPRRRPRARSVMTDSSAYAKWWREQHD